MPGGELSRRTAFPEPRVHPTMPRWSARGLNGAADLELGPRRLPTTGGRGLPRAHPGSNVPHGADHDVGTAEEDVVRRVAH